MARIGIFVFELGMACLLATIWRHGLIAPTSLTRDEGPFRIVIYQLEIYCDVSPG